MAASNAFLAAAFASTTLLPVVHADTPAPLCADIPRTIALVGTNGGVPDPAGAFQVVVRGITCQPIHGAMVVVDFRDCLPDIRLCSVQADGITTDCAIPVGEVSAITDIDGIARFTIVGGANNPNGRAPGYATFGCAKVYADGVALGDMGVSAYDQNLSGGVNPADLSSWLADAFSGTLYRRSDFDGNAVIAPPDMSRLLSVALGGGSTESCAVYCR